MSVNDKHKILWRRLVIMIKKMNSNDDQTIGNKRKKNSVKSLFLSA